VVAGVSVKYIVIENMHLFFIPAVFLGSQFHMVNTAGQDGTYWLHRSDI